ncbi:hypothetical protein ACIQUB_22695 [Rhizobium sp. NPDC090275]|uniref:hypothetical protein n=1 Tax=Rhizobium sp. NPDC090275 TaxID=3364498 RepID=UPI00383B14CD
MPNPLVDKQGKFIQPPLRSFNRYIELGMNCILKLKIDDAENPEAAKSIQFSMTPQQCRDLAENLKICADVIEWERPTSPQ